MDDAFLILSIGYLDLILLSSSLIRGICIASYLYHKDAMMKNILYEPARNQKKTTCSFDLNFPSGVYTFLGMK